MSVIRHPKQFSRGVYLPSPHKSVMLGPKQSVELHAASTIYIAPLCCAVIPHNTEISLVGDATLLILSRLPDVFMTMNLIVDGGFIEPGEVSTAVFNLSNHRIRVARGLAISRLVAL